MQHLLTCGKCGQQVYIESSLQMAQACPVCQSVLSHAPNSQATQQRSPSAQNVESRASDSPSQPVLQDPFQQPTDETGPQLPSEQQYLQPPVSQKPIAQPSKPELGGHLEFRNSNRPLYIAVGIGGGIFGLLLIAVLFFLFADARRNNKLVSDDSPNSGNSSEGNQSKTSSEQNDRSRNHGNNGMFDENARSNMATYGSLPSFGGATSKNREVAYRWKSNSKFEYQYRYTMTGGSKDFSMTGTNRLMPSFDSPSTMLDPEENESEGGTGTCFFVHPDGLAVTCAHVVEGAKKVEVHHDGQWYLAEVVAIDGKNDLALLKIKSGKLPVLPISDSKDLALAQTIHVIGFPIQDMLGTSVKFNSGAVSGFKTEHGVSEVQFDASINPGNSGGPVIDQAGNVVAVASAMFQGEGLNSVAIGVRTDRVLELLRRNKIQLPVSTFVSPASSNSILAKKTTPSVCLVRSTGRTGLQVVNFKTDVRVGSQAAGKDFATINGKLLANDAGEIVSYGTQGGGISFFLFTPSTIGIAKLDLYNGEKWRHRDLKIIAKPDTKLSYSSRSNPFGGGVVRPPRRYGYQIMPVVPTTESTVTMVLALETSNYEKIGDKGNIVTFKVNRKTTSIDQDTSSDGYLTASLSGTIDFDKSVGLISNIDLEGTMMTRLGGSLQEFSVHYVVKRERKSTRSNTRPDIEVDRDGNRTTSQSSSPSNTTTKKEATDPRLIQEIDQDTGVSALALSPDSKFLFVGGRGVKAFDIATKQQISTVKVDRITIVELVATEGSSSILAKGISGKVAVINYDANGKLEEPRVIFRNPGRVTAMAVSNDGQVAVTSNNKRTVCVWDLKTGDLLHRLTGFSLLINSIYISPDKSLGYVCDFDSVKKVDFKMGKILETQKMKRTNLRFVNFTSDGKSMLLGNFDNIEIYDLESKEIESKIELPGILTSMRISPDSKSVYSGSGSNTLTKWELSTKRKVDEFRVRLPYGFAVNRSSDGEHLAVFAGGKKSVRILKMKK